MKQVPHYCISKKRTVQLEHVRALLSALQSLEDDDDDNEDDHDDGEHETFWHKIEMKNIAKKHSD